MKPSKILGKIPVSQDRRSGSLLLASICVTVIALSTPPNQTRGAQKSGRFDFLAAAAPVYSADPNDSWNGIFYYLFSRRVETHLTDEFPDAAPFTFGREGDPRGVMLPSLIGISTRSFERDEIGDRAIDPLYPSFFVSTGAEAVLADPAYSGLSKALEQALAENAPRSPFARAFLQSDLWSAYDILYARVFNQPGKEQIEQRRRALMDLLARLMRRIALSGREIDSLPANYTAAAPRQSLPELFRNDSGWIEVKWFSHRLHDEAAGYRRVTRVFVKPARPPSDVKKFLNSLPGDENQTTDLDGVALVIQLLLIDSNGRLTPTRITTDVQARLFEKTSNGAFKTTAVKVSEISRRIFLGDVASGGLVADDENTPAYLAASGNDFTFASPLFSIGAPVQAKLRTRCTACHGTDLGGVRTFAFMLRPHSQPPLVMQLSSDGHQAADEVMETKAKQKSFESLQVYFNGSN